LWLAQRKREEEVSKAKSKKPLTKEEAEAIAKRDAARARVQQRTMQGFGLGFWSKWYRLLKQVIHIHAAALFVVKTMLYASWRYIDLSYLVVFLLPTSILLPFCLSAGRKLPSCRLPQALKTAERQKGRMILPRQTDFCRPWSATNVSWV
jgi:hypothetical protein